MSFKIQKLYSVFKKFNSMSKNCHSKFKNCIQCSKTFIQRSKTLFSVQEVNSMFKTFIRSWKNSFKVQCSIVVWIAWFIFLLLQGKLRIWACTENLLTIRFGVLRVSYEFHSSLHIYFIVSKVFFKPLWCLDHNTSVTSSSK